MAKIKSSLPNMILSLSLISLVMAAALGSVYVFTKEPIEKARQKKVAEAVSGVLPAFDNDPIAEAYYVADGKDTVYFYPAKMNDKLVGTAVKTYTNKGFNGYVSIMAGLLPDGTINQTIVLDQKETPGLGSLMTGPAFSDQFNGKNPDQFKLKVKKDGGDVDAITAATISSRAYCDALQRAVDLYKEKNDIADNSAKPQIEMLKLEDIEVLKGLMPAFDNDPLKEVTLVDSCEIFTGKKGNRITGYAIKTYAFGYNDEFPVWVLTAFKPDGTINKVTVLKHKESADRGKRVCSEEFISQFDGQNPANFNPDIADDGGNVDAVSGCTVTSRAVSQAVKSACAIFEKGGLK